MTFKHQCFLLPSVVFGRIKGPPKLFWWVEIQYQWSTTIFVCLLTTLVLVNIKQREIHLPNISKTINIFHDIVFSIFIDDLIIITKNISDPLVFLQGGKPIFQKILQLWWFVLIKMSWSVVISWYIRQYWHWFCFLIPYVIHLHCQVSYPIWN